MNSDSRITWNPDNVARFWDYIAAQPALQAEYFARRYGEEIANFLSLVRPLSGLQVLDYGAGPGYLVPHLLCRGAMVAALDHSPDSVAKLNAKLAGRDGWQGAYVAGDAGIPWAESYFDLICCVETIEHVIAECLPTLLEEVRRLLKVGGVALFTTPNEENLEASQVRCPNCGVEFHRWQHIRSWSAGTLRNTLTEHGFNVFFCHGVNLRAFQTPTRVSWKDLSPRKVARALKLASARMADWLFPRPFPFSRRLNRLVRTHSQPHLIAVAGRSSP